MSPAAGRSAETALGPRGWLGAPPARSASSCSRRSGTRSTCSPSRTRSSGRGPAAASPGSSSRCRTSLVAGHPAIDDFIVFERRRGLRALEGFAGVRRALKRRHFDLLLGLQVYFKAGLITGLARARGQARVRPGAGAGPAVALHQPTGSRAHAPQHVQDQYFEFLRLPRRRSRAGRPGISRSRDDERGAQARLLRGARRPRLRGRRGRRASPRRTGRPSGYAQLLERIESDFGLRPRAGGRAVAGGAPASRTEVLASDGRARRERARTTTCAGWSTSWRGARCSSARTPARSTSPRALGTPVVGLFGHTNPKRSGPTGPIEDLVVDGYAEHPGEDYPITPRYRDGWGG